MSSASATAAAADDELQLQEATKTKAANKDPNAVIIKQADDSGAGFQPQSTLAKESKSSNPAIVSTTLAVSAPSAIGEFGDSAGSTTAIKSSFGNVNVYSGGNSSNNNNNNNNNNESNNDNSSNVLERRSSQHQQQQLFCSNCLNRIEAGQFVRALGGCFHTNCFRCQDCNKVVADRFFPLDNGDGKLSALCERDYFKRLNLICAKCGEALRGSYINAIGKKFHLEHFTCSKCPTVFGPDETYYEHDGDIFCHFHYSIEHAARCGGCRIPILKQFVEVRSANREQWHPECYMIFKAWSLRMASYGRPDINKPSTAEEALLQERLMEEKVNRIWTVLSAFEESAAACISDMLLHVSNQNYGEAVAEAGNFILHVEALFGAMDSLEKMIAKYSDNIGLSYNKEPKLLCKKIVNFFSLLAHAHDPNSKQFSSITQDLLSLVTSLAQYLKVLIRIALAGALKLERTYGEKMAIGDLLSRMVELGQQQTDAAAAGLKFDQRYGLVDFEVKSDLCMACKVSIEEACIKLGVLRWHKKCFVCSVTRRELVVELANSSYDPVENAVLGPNQERPGAKKGFEKVTQLQQFVFLLRVALKRLHSLLKIRDDSLTNGSLSRSDTMSSTTDGGSSNNNLSAGLSKLQQAQQQKRTSLQDLRRQLIDGSGSNNATGASATTTTTTGANAAGTETAASAPAGSQPSQTQTQQPPQIEKINDKSQVKKTVEQPEYVGSVHNLIENLYSQDLARQKSIRAETASIQQQSKSSAITQQAGLARPEGGQLSPPAISPSSSTAAEDQGWPMSSSSAGGANEPPSPQHQQARQRNSAVGANRIMFFAELSALEAFIVRHVTLLKLHPLVQEYFTMSELLDVIRNRKTSFWIKIINTLNPVKKQVRTKEDGTFGVPLDMLLEKSGIDSKHGAGLGRLKIPAFVDLTITALKTMDLMAEGIFRKNGNIKNLTILQEKIDKDVWSVDYSKEGPIQLAALLKKFLREMPEPLLTFKLHKLFVLSQKPQTLEQRKRILHLCVCLLPKPNRDLLEVFLVFLRQVASYSGDDSGNKMDLNNLATVIAPNILYGKPKDDKSKIISAKDESFLAIDAVKMLMQYQDEMWMVPQDIVEIMAASDIPEGATDLSQKDVLKKYEMLMSSKKAHSSKDAYSEERSSTAASTPVATVPIIEETIVDEPMLDGTAISGVSSKKK